MAASASCWPANTRAVIDSGVSSVPSISDVARPLLSTMMRLQVVASSSKSLDTQTTDMPSSAAAMILR